MSSKIFENVDYSGIYSTNVKEKVVQRLIARKKTVSRSVVTEQTVSLGDPMVMYKRFFEPMVDGKFVSDAYVKRITNSWKLTNGVVDNHEQDEDLKRKFLEYRKDISKCGIPVKLYINSLENNSSGSLKRIGARLLSTYGLVHCGIQLGPWLLDWNTTELIEPRPLKSNSKILAILDLKHNIPNDEKNLQEVCTLISNWNQEYHYSSVGRSLKKALKTQQANCHCFTKVFFQHFKIKKYWKKNGMISRYLKKVKQLDYDVKRKFRQTEFKTHAELDEFYLKRYVKEGRKLDVEAYELLKSFDRAFWLSGDLTTECPFLNDLATVNDSKGSENPFNVTRCAHFHSSDEN